MTARGPSESRRTRPVAAPGGWIGGRLGPWGLHVLAWLALFGAIVALTRPFHPTWTIDVIVSFLFVAFYAAAVYLDAFGLTALEARWGLPPYLATVLAAEAALTLALVGAIQAVYAVLWHPDPRRFGFWFNFGSDFLGMNVVLLASRGLGRLVATPRI